MPSFCSKFPPIFPQSQSPHSNTPGSPTRSYQAFFSTSSPRTHHERRNSLSWPCICLSFAWGCLRSTMPRSMQALPTATFSLLARTSQLLSCIEFRGFVLFGWDFRCSCFGGWLRGEGIFSCRCCSWTKLGSPSYSQCRLRESPLQRLGGLFIIGKAFSLRNPALNAVLCLFLCFNSPQTLSFLSLFDLCCLIIHGCFNSEKEKGIAPHAVLGNELADIWFWEFEGAVRVKLRFPFACCPPGHLRQPLFATLGNPRAKVSASKAKEAQPFC